MHIDLEIISDRLISNLPSTIILIIPNAVLLRAKGSFELLGCFPIIKNPAKVSVLSIRETIFPRFVLVIYR